ncbi:helix-turn-helix transcriptional regulator [Pseudomonas matsuisoli]|uniref:Transcriptional regulator n=1 Tax=Pseudomonas matsuisoli TaxID=1515666 RepID=A0A917PX66_9PSED|nr:helix-turn-helix transcriptional regulator [Pseudomonas matsuisoli]GGJ96421.1 transcriptional regulator [Pseudomonas matsuisoli]
MCQPSNVMRAADLSERSHGRIRLIGREVADTPLFEGRVNWIRLRAGLTLHCSDCVELQSFTTESRMEPRLSFVLFMAGDNQVRYGDRSVAFKAQRAHEQDFQGLALSVKEPVVFSRRSRQGTHIRKIAINLGPEWFESGGLDDQPYQDVLRFTEQHLAAQHWQPSPRLKAIAEQLLNPPDHAPMLQRLYLESRVLDIAAEALSGITHCAPLKRMTLRPHEHQRMRQVAALLESGEADDWTLEMIARNAGINVNSLQRQFRQFKGMTVFEYQRSRKLETARQALEREGMSVTQAAWLAGYTSPANFSTAFKRHFGMTPRQAMCRV